VLDGTVLMPGSRIAPGVRLTDTIVAPGTPVPEGLVIGEDPREDARWFRRTEAGTTLVTTQMLARRTAERAVTIAVPGRLRGLLGRPRRTTEAQ
jgi:glucose-1-phosphate adenylyltransferase